MERGKRLEPRWPSEVPEKARRQALCRYHVIVPLLSERDGSSQAVAAVCEAAGRSRATVFRWLRGFRENGLMGLVPRSRSDRGTISSVDARLRRKIEKWYLEKARRTIRQVWTLACKDARRRRKKTPSYKTVWKVVKSLDPATICLAREGRKAYRDRFEPIRRHEVERPNQRFHIDHTRVDVLLLRPGEKSKRPWLTGVLDARSRSLMGYYLSFDHPSTLGVSLALRMAILPKGRDDWPMCGIPEEVYVDNGADLVSDHMWEAAANLRFDLVPGQTGYRHNAKLERFFGTAGTGFLSELPGYTDSSVTKRPERVEAELTLEEFEERFLEWLLGTYHRRKNDTTKQRPIRRWDTGFVPRLPESARELDLLLVHEAKPRRITPEGIRLFTRFYMAEELVPWIREWAVVRYDPRDLSEVQVYIRDRFVGSARASDPEHPFCDIRTMKQLQRRRRKHVEEELRSHLGHLVPAQPEAGARTGGNGQGGRKPRKGNPEKELVLFECDLVKS